jgi:hypothetical protein
LRSAFPAGLKDPFNFNAEQIREDIKSSSSIAMNTDDRPLLEGPLAIYPISNPIFR